MWWMTPTYIDENILIGLRRSSAVTDRLFLFVLARSERRIGAPLA
jgi:hypothetical protein